MNFNNIQLNVLASICQFLDLKDIVRLSETNKHINNKIFTTTLFQKIFEAKLNMKFDEIPLPENLITLKKNNDSTTNKKILNFLQKSRLLFEETISQYQNEEGLKQNVLI